MEDRPGILRVLGPTEARYDAEMKEKLFCNDAMLHQTTTWQDRLHVHSAVGT